MNYLLLKFIKKPINKKAQIDKCSQISFEVFKFYTCFQIHSTQNMKKHQVNKCSILEHDLNHQKVPKCIHKCNKY